MIISRKFDRGGSVMVDAVDGALSVTGKAKAKPKAVATAVETDILGTISYPSTHLL